MKKGILFVLIVVVTVIFAAPLAIVLGPFAIILRMISYGIRAAGNKQSSKKDSE